jgi:pyridoxamine 5'-phosphate oxidase
LLKNLDQGKFLFFTNYESRKGIQISQNPWASLLFFWADEERQVRVEGRVSRISRSKSVAYFNERPLESRISAVVSPQSSTIPDRMFLEVMRDGVILDLDGKSPVCPKNWGGYQLRPLLFEFWQGRANRLHDRIQYRFAGKRWLRERLAP